MKMAEDSKRCPFCDEIVRKNAIKCRHCGSIISADDSTAHKDAPDTLVKNYLGENYEIKGAIGSGGMAVVYRAVQKNLQRDVALKVVHQNLVHEKEFISRFLREARVGASLNHPNIVTIYDVGSSGPVNYMAMEFLEGKTLRDIIRENKVLTVEKTIKFIAPLANALSYLHKNNLVHRDIKTANVIIAKNKPVLADFGIVFVRGEERLSEVGSVVGTPEYMSPEQAIGKTEVDHRADIYSLGIMIYECLTGSVPFHSTNPLTTVHNLLNERPKEPKTPNKNIPMWLNALILDCLVKDPDNRIQSCDIVEDALKKKEYKRNTKITKKKTATAEYSTIKMNNDDIQIPVEKRPKKKSKSLLLSLLVPIVLILFGVAYINFLAPDGVKDEFLTKYSFLNISGYEGPQTDVPPVNNNSGTVSGNSSNETPTISNVSKSFVVDSTKADNLKKEPVLNQDSINSAKIAAAIQDSLSKMKAADDARQQEEARIKAERDAEANKKREEDEKARKAQAERDRIEAERLAKIQKELNSKLEESKLSNLKSLGINLVYIQKPSGNYYIGQYEVSQKLWESIMGNNPSVNKGANNPVETISKFDIVSFLTVLQGSTDLTFRLPTVEEWEYAAKANKNFKYSGGDLLSDVAWYEANSDYKVHTVGTKKANAFNIYDMSGNVAALCLDGTVKGGSYMSTYNQCEISYSEVVSSDKKDWTIGFRLVLVYSRK